MKLLLHFLMGGIYGDIPVKSCTFEGIYKQSKLKKIISPYNPILDNELPMLSIVNCILFLKKKKRHESCHPMEVYALGRTNVGMASCRLVYEKSPYLQNSGNLLPIICHY